MKLILIFNLFLGIANAVPAGAPPPSGQLEQRGWWPWGLQWDMPCDWTPNGFMGNANLGSPEDKLRVFVDWTWVSLLVMTPRCWGEYNPSACLHPKQKTFDPRKSTSFKNLSSEYPDRTWKPNHFFFEDPAHVTIGADKLQVGPVTGEVVAQMTDLTFDVGNRGFPYPFQAIFGMSPVFENDPKDYQVPFYQQWQDGKWRTSLTGFAYCYEESKKKACNGNDAIQTLGGIRYDLVKNGRIWWYDNVVFPDVNNLDFIYDPPVYNYWGIELEALKIGDESQNIERTSESSGKGAIFDHATYGRGIALTPNAHIRLAEVTGARPAELVNPPNNGPNSFYSVDCSKISSFPDVKYQFQGHSREWVVKPETYVAKLDDGTCVLNVRALADGDKFIGNFGETFAIDKYIIFDFEKLRVGLADMRWPWWANINWPNMPI